MHHAAFFANNVSGTTNVSISSIDAVTEKRYDRSEAVEQELLLDGDPGIVVKIVDFGHGFPSSKR